MIPDRKLMEAWGLGDALLHTWVANITDMLKEGPRVVLKLEKIRKAAVVFPEPMLLFSKNRIVLWMLKLD
jgi:hypothetical protein